MSEGASRDEPRHHHADAPAGTNGDSDSPERGEWWRYESPQSGTGKPRAGTREAYRQQLLNSIGGWSGSIITAIPTVVFVAVNAVATLHWAIAASVASALLLAGYRLARRQSVQQALAGLVGVVIASIIAARTGEAKGYFLLGIWSSFVYAGALAATLVVRRPAIGLLWEFLDPTPHGAEPTPWYRRRPLLLAYTLATAGATLVFLARGLVQLTLFEHNATGWLAVTRILMGYPLYIVAIGFAFWVVRRARHRLGADAAAS